MNAASKTSMQTEWAMLQDLNLSDDKAAHPVYQQSIVIDDISAASKRMSRIPAGANGQGGH